MIYATVLFVLFSCFAHSLGIVNFEGSYDSVSMILFTDRRLISVIGEAVAALIEFKSKLIDPFKALESWDSSNTSPCVWFHIECEQEKVTRIDLANAYLSGVLAPSLGSLPYLQYLELYSNNITGTIPEELGKLTNLVNMDLYFNNLEGSIPSSLGNLKKLRNLRLNNNSLTGAIPVELTSIATLKVLYVLPHSSRLSLFALPMFLCRDISNNKLTGDIPTNGSFAGFTPISFANNRLNPSLAASPSVIPPSRSGGMNTKAIIVGVLVGAALLLATPLIVFALWRNGVEEVFVDVPDEEDARVHLEQLRRFTLKELQIATDNFNRRNVLGWGGFGKVYKGRLRDGSLVAIKRLKEERSHAGELQFQNEIALISLAVHRNLIRLRGYCTTPTERILVYPFMANGSVQSCLKDRPPGRPPLSWEKRRRIALGTARGLAYLHVHCNPKIIHRDVKAANILLDEDFEPVVGDFGLAKLMNYNDTHVTTGVCGTIGHIAPEYLSTGKASEYSDVFGYGITLLQLVTGQKPINLSRLANGGEVLLLDWVMEIMVEKRFDELVDSDMGGRYNAREVEEVMQIAILCTCNAARDRPPMADVVRMMEGDELTERWQAWKRVVHFRRLNSDGIILPASNGESVAFLPSDELSGPR